ncbi:MAG: hypothetical protein IJI87_07445 [Mogibacterium sp.]|nr:hypothetical protein [Mogibacterium sp.]
MDFLKVNGKSIPYSNSFELTQAPNIVNEVVTMNGNTQADINGWKYENTTLRWDYLRENDLNTLLAETDPINGPFELSFYEPGSNAYKTVKAIRVGRVIVKTRFKRNGSIVWTGINLELTFPEAYGG